MVIAGSFFAMMAVMIPPIISTFTAVERFAAQHPDQVTRTVGPNGYSIMVHGNHPELMPNFSQMIFGLGVISFIVVLLLASAVTRRLHDCNRTGAWGLPPVVLLFTSLFGMSRLFGRFDDPEGPPMGLFFGMLLNNLVYLVSLAVLLILVAMKGTPGDNRFGPPPA